MVSVTLMREIAVGERVPDVFVTSEDGTELSLLAALGGPSALFFYPQDDTEGCTLEAQEFDALLPEFHTSGIALFGISPDTPQSHKAFRAKYDLTVPLLADGDHKAADAFGLWRSKTTFGRTYIGLVRTTVLIGADGVVAAILPARRIKGHAAQVLERARAIWKT
jgi:thioredoxin-dependent peroxiredoxin